MGEANSEKFEHDVHGSESTTGATGILEFLHEIKFIIWFSRETKVKCDQFEGIGMNLATFLEVKFVFFIVRKRFLFEDLNRFRPVYSAKDFLDVISVLINPNLKIDEALWK